MFNSLTETIDESKDKKIKVYLLDSYVHRDQLHLYDDPYDNQWSFGKFPSFRLDYCVKKKKKQLSSGGKFVSGRYWSETVKKHWRGHSSFKKIKNIYLYTVLYEIS